MLTPKQADLLRFIEAELAGTGIAPSFEEMCEHMGLSAKSGIHRLLTGLEERGYIRRLYNRARAIDVLRSPAQPAPRYASPRPVNYEVVYLPLHGRID